jgi:hypothetical protein
MIAGRFDPGEGPVAKATVAEQYARERGLEYYPQARTPIPSPYLGLGHSLVGAAVVGAIAGTRPGMVYRCAGGTGGGSGPPGAHYEIPGLRERLDGLWVRRGGRSIWTRPKLPSGFAELRFDDQEFDSNYRVGVRSPASEPAARELLDREYTQWHVVHAMQDPRNCQGGSFEIVDGHLFIRGPYFGYKNLETLDNWALTSVAIADRVAAFVARSDGR